MTSRIRANTLAARATAMRVFDNRVIGRRALLATTILRIVGGLLFLASAIPEITAHQNEVDMFGTFGLPRSSTLVYLVTALDISCALLLLLGLLTRLAAAAMAANMIGAILTAGTHVGGPIHLGLAPTLLAAMLYLIWAGPGVAALDRKWARLADRGQH